MHFPEFALSSGGDRRFVRQHGTGIRGRGACFKIRRACLCWRISARTLAERAHENDSKSENTSLETIASSGPLTVLRSEGNVVWRFGDALGVTTTPTFFINGHRLVGPQGCASLGAVIKTVLAGIPKSQRVQDEIVASGPAQQINLEHAPTKGPATAPISLVEFSDFECPFCAETAPVVHGLLAAYPTRIRFAFKHYPLPMHKEALLAHEAALAANEQGNFWEMHDLIFKTQDKLTRDDLIAKAAQLNLDVLRFTRDPLSPLGASTYSRSLALVQRLAHSARRYCCNSNPTQSRVGRACVAGRAGHIL